VWWWWWWWWWWWRLQAQWGVILFLTVFGIAIRGYQLGVATWEVASDNWKLLCFPCLSVLASSDDDAEQPNHEPEPAHTSQNFELGRPLSHPLYGYGWAVERVNGTFVVCFPDGSSAKYAMTLGSPFACVYHGAPVQVLQGRAGFRLHNRGGPDAHVGPGHLP
jgi:hypothetical protein